MRTEISAIFTLQSASEMAVENAYIGSGVYIQRLESDWLHGLRTQCPKLEAREQIEPLRPYTHRIFYKLDREEQQSTYSYRPSADEMWALVILLLSQFGGL